MFSISSKMYLEIRERTEEDKITQADMNKNIQEIQPNSKTKEKPLVKPKPKTAKPTKPKEIDLKKYRHAEIPERENINKIKFKNTRQKFENVEKDCPHYIKTRTPPTSRQTMDGSSTA